MGQPFGIAVDGAGNVLVGLGCRVLKVAPDGGAQTMLNTAPCGDSRPSDKFDDLLDGVTLDDSGDVLVTDWWNEIHPRDRARRHNDDTGRDLSASRRHHRRPCR